MSSISNLNKNFGQMPGNIKGATDAITKNKEAMD
jgi:hypothetical protein